MPGKHLSSRYDEELSTISANILKMGGLVESQVRNAILSIIRDNPKQAEDVLAAEAQVNELERVVDNDLISVIAKRQPTARDLRLVMGVAKMATNLERAGDEAEKIARMVLSLEKRGNTHGLPVRQLDVSMDMAVSQLRRVLDAFARLDVEASKAVIEGDNRMDAEYGSFIRTLITHMMEDPRTIGASIDLLFLAKALERVGDHAKNIAEQVIFVAEGIDMRDMSEADADDESAELQTKGRTEEE